MQFIGTGDRILTENFNVGYLYTITFKSGNYINTACIGIGDNFVMFQRTEPDLLFTLNVDTAEDVDTIVLYDSGGGTNDYDDLVNRPQINSHTLTGNMSGADLGLQNTISDLDTIRSGAAAGATAVQPATMEVAVAQKQDALSSEQLEAVNSGITAADVAQIDTNKNNILWHYTETSYSPNNANVYEYTGISFTVPANEVYEFYAADRNDSSANDIFSAGIIVADNSSNVALKASTIAENSGTPAQAPNYWMRAVNGITPKRKQNTTFYIWVNRTSTSTSGRIIIAYRKMVIQQA